MIRDRIVCGIQNPEIQRRLLSEKDLKLQSAIDIAVSMETAVNNSLDLQVLLLSHLQPPCTKPFISRREVGLPRVSSRNASGVVQVITCPRHARIRIKSAIYATRLGTWPKSV
ncbi:hypothetical protein JTE90_023234 [Oedothorax gibbosus]|uniref:Uncharacterized protein n=1 Tax=Oedothorax gibbosus TaxID=931172 RepID=A0AAV6TQ16_9ARAC|nr:hypothetical protein JTE90_023234 [Oedothorax gibbosus]